MKRTLIIVISVIAAASLIFSGCGRKKTAEEETTPEIESSIPVETTKAAEKQSTTAATTTAEETTESFETYFTGYSIRVNLAYCCVTVYECYSDGTEAPIRSMACSCGRAGCETPEGVFYTSDGGEWGYMADGSWGRYFRRFNGGILFHSVPSYEMDPGTIEFGEYNKLGSPASLGCIRLCVADAQWIYYNMPWGTEVVVYTDYSSPGPWGMPGTYKVPDDIPQVCQWDPTDPTEGNPWHSYSFSFSPKQITLPVGSTKDDLYNQINVTDNYGNSVKHYAYIETDTPDYNTPGTYTVYGNISLATAYAEDWIEVTIIEQEEQ